MNKQLTEKDFPYIRGRRKFLNKGIIPITFVASGKGLLDEEKNRPFLKNLGIVAGSGAALTSIGTAFLGAAKKVKLRPSPLEVSLTAMLGATIFSTPYVIGRAEGKLLKHLRKNDSSTK